jgi:hypothetical protein
MSGPLTGQLAVDIVGRLALGLGEDQALSDINFRSRQSAAASLAYAEWAADTVRTCRHRPSPGDAAAMMLSDPGRVVCLDCLEQVYGRPSACDNCFRPFDRPELDGRELYKTHCPAGALLVVGTVCPECKVGLGGSPQRPRQAPIAPNRAARRAARRRK